MGLFGKKDKKEEVKKNILSIPELPELPKLPELPYMDEFSYEDNSLPQLPKFPNNPLGDKFSQNTIKEAISGKKEDKEVFDAEDFPEEERSGMMQKPLQRPLREDFEDYEESISTKPRSKGVSQNFVAKNYMTKKAEPIFIRIDKFEEALDVFKKVQGQISEIEKDLSHLKKIKEEETKELDFWEKQIQEIKQQVEKIDSEIFSKVD